MNELSKNLLQRNKEKGKPGKAADELLQEATKHLAEETTWKDYEEISLPQGMLAGAVGKILKIKQIESHRILINYLPKTSEQDLIHGSLLIRKIKQNVYFQS